LAIAAIVSWNSTYMAERLGEPPQTAPKTQRKTAARIPPGGMVETIWFRNSQAG
jgi:hypothetical protein